MLTNSCFSCNPCNEYTCSTLIRNDSVTVVKLDPRQGSIKEPRPKKMENAVTLWPCGGQRLAGLVEYQTGHHGCIGFWHSDGRVGWLGASCKIKSVHTLVAFMKECIE